MSKPRKTVKRRNHAVPRGTPNSFVMYEGPSMLDGAPIVVIATCIVRESTNEKTGPMIQTFILRQDIHPLEAIARGADVSICGNCPARGVYNPVTQKWEERICYVDVAKSVVAVWEAYKRGNIPRVTPERAREILAGRVVRLGAYGDPSAAPFAVWANALADVTKGTGYIHQWRNPAFADFKRYCMASCDTAQDFADATAAGWRCFRMRGEFDPLLENEIACPASDEIIATRPAGWVHPKCFACRACFGTSAKAKVNIAIVAHGKGKGAYERAHAA
jgi:hypothetical protein